jgi:hypothetical protein
MLTLNVHSFRKSCGHQNAPEKIEANEKFWKKNWTCKLGSGNFCTEFTQRSYRSCKKTHNVSTWSEVICFDGIPITYYWTGLLTLDHSYLVGNLTSPKIAETKALEPLESCHFCISNFSNLLVVPTTYEWSKIRGSVQ